MNFEECLCEGCCQVTHMRHTCVNGEAKHELNRLDFSSKFDITLTL